MTIGEKTDRDTTASRTRLALAVALAATTAAPAQAAEPADEGAGEHGGLPVIMVTAPGEEASTFRSGTRLDAQTLSSERAATSDTASLLDRLPGVSLQGAGPVSSLPIVHGLADERIRTRLDGMDLIAACPNHMNPPLSYLDPAQVGEARVWAGITPVSVGGDSIGGTIEVDTLPATFAEPGEGVIHAGEVGTSYRSNGNARSANLSATLATDTVSLSYSGGWSKADNYDAGGDFKATTETGRPGHELPLDEVGSTAYETRNHLLGLALRNENHLLEAKFGYQDMPYQLYPNQRMDMTENTEKRGSLRYEGEFGWGGLEARAWHEVVDHEMDFGDDKQFWYPSGSPCSPIGGMPDPCAAGMPMLTESENSGLRLKADLDLAGGDTLRVGAEYQRYRLDDYWPPSGGGMWPDTFWNIRDGQRDRMAVFGEWESRLAKDWTVLAGLRYERVTSDAGDAVGYNDTPGQMNKQYEDAQSFNARDHERTDNNVDLTALARWEIDATRSLEFGLARKVRSPGLYERYPWSTWTMAAVMNNFVGDGNGYVGNLDLDPEVAYTASTTFDWRAADDAWSLRVAPYVTYVEDYIDAQRLPAYEGATESFVVLQYVNQDALLYGVDLSGRLTLAETDRGRFGLEGALEYTHGENRDTDDGLYNIVPLEARVALTHELGGWNSAVEVEGVAAKDDSSEVRNEIETAGFALVNLRAGYQWERVRVDVGVDNLFDRLYADPTGGAYLGQGKTMSIKGVPWGVSVPGAGRSIHAGVTVSF
ncbi:MAG: TonB-dependent receptor [Pseudomonadota bacterium]